MDSDLTKALIDRLEQKATPSFNQKMSDLVSQFENKRVGDRLEKAFEQVMHKTDIDSIVPNTDSFEQQVTLKSSLKKDMLMKGFGASISGSVGGVISGFLPINFGIQGLPQILGGVLISKVAKGGTGGNIAEGMTITGIGLAISGLLGGSLNGILGSLGGRTTSTPSTAGVMF